MSTHTDNTALVEQVKELARVRAEHLRLSYLVAIVFMSALAVIAILGIELLRPTKDNTQLITSVMGMIVPTTAALLVLLRGNSTEQSVQEIHLAVNSRLSELLEQTAKSERAAGLAAGLAGSVPPPAPPPVILPVIVQTPALAPVPAPAQVTADVVRPPAVVVPETPAEKEATS